MFRFSLFQAQPAPAADAAETKARSRARNAVSAHPVVSATHCYVFSVQSTTSPRPLQLKGSEATSIALQPVQPPAAPKLRWRAGELSLQLRF